MPTSRLEAFSDGVLAIIITIMVLTLKIPDGVQWSDLNPLWPTLLAYLLSFIYVGIYWNNHHHLMYITEKINGKILWANLHLLFWLSLLPFATGWLGVNYLDSRPVAIYGFILMMCAIAWKIMAGTIISSEGENSKLGKVYAKDKKQNLSTLLYATGIICAFFLPVISLTLYVIVAALWIVPDPRIEKAIAEQND